METYTLQATGYPAITIVGRILGESTQRLDDRRAVSVTLYERHSSRREGLPFAAVVTYSTRWPMERNYTRIFQGPTLDILGTLIREAAKYTLPPGAGYPATEAYHERQQKLVGQMETLTLDALTVALRQAATAP